MQAKALAAASTKRRRPTPLRTAYEYTEVDSLWKLATKTPASKLVEDKEIRNGDLSQEVAPVAFLSGNWLKARAAALRAATSDDDGQARSNAAPGSRGERAGGLPSAR